MMKGKTLTLISKGVAVLFAMGMFKWSARSAAEIGHLTRSRPKGGLTLCLVRLGRMGFVWTEDERVCGPSLAGSKPRRA